jgi:hypothetical protein
VKEPALKASHSFAVAALLALVLLGANYKLTLGLAVPKWDADQYFGPSQMLIADHARAGRFLLWDPWVNGGSPDYAEPQIPSFSPLAVGVGFLTGGTELAFRVYWLVSWFLGAGGVVLLGRHLQAPDWGCLVVALGFAFSGFYTGHAEHTSSLYTISTLPIVIWRLDVALSRQTLRPAVEAGVVWGASGLGGYPAWVFLNACFALFWALGRCWFPASTNASTASRNTGVPSSIGGRPTVRVAAVALTALTLTGLVVLLPTYVAFFLEAPGYSDRAQPLPRDVAVTSNALHPGTVATIASPYLSILKLDNPELWAYTDLSTASVYLGPLSPVLAVLALVARRRDAWRWWLVALALGFWLAALGQSLPFRGWLYDLVPPTRYFRHPGFFRIYTMFVLVVLALLGTRDLTLASRGLRSLAKPFAVIAGVVWLLAIAAYYAVLLTVGHTGHTRTSAAVHLWVMWTSVFSVALAMIWTPGNARMRIMRQLLTTVAIVDVLFTVHLAQPTMYQDGSFKAIQDRVAAAHNSSLDLGPGGLQRYQLAPAWSTSEGMPQNKNVLLKIPTLENYMAFYNRFHLDQIKRPVLSAMATGPSRFWCSSRVVVAPASDATHSAFVARSESLGKGVLVIHSRDQL